MERAVARYPYERGAPDSGEWRNNLEDASTGPPPQQASGGSHTARRHTGPGPVVGAFLGASTAIGTIVGGTAYAILWNAYSSFYSAFGLTPEEVGLSQERLVVPAILSGLAFVFLLAAIAVPAFSGYRLVPVWLIARRPIVPMAIVFFGAAMLGGLWIPLFTNDPDFGIFVATAAITAFSLGVYYAMKSWKMDPTRSSTGAVVRWLVDADVHWFAAVVLGFACWVLLASFCAGLRHAGVDPLLQIAILAGPCAIVSLVLLTFDRQWWAYELPAEHAEEAERAVAARRRRRRVRVVLISVALAAVLGLLGVREALMWSYSQSSEGVSAVQLGYRHSDLDWLEPTVRPIMVTPLDASRDPLGVCGDAPPYAASLIAKDDEGWWVLLRATNEEQPSGYRVRVVWLRRDTYTIDLAPMAHQPRTPESPGAQPPASTGPRPWIVPACFGAQR